MKSFCIAAYSQPHLLCVWALSPPAPILQQIFELLYLRDALTVQYKQLTLKIKSLINWQDNYILYISPLPGGPFPSSK